MMPSLDLTQQCLGAAALHREIRLRRRKTLNHARSLELLPLLKTLILQVVDDRADMNKVKHRIVDEEPDHRDPEIIILEMFGQPGSGKGLGQSRIPTKP